MDTSPVGVTQRFVAAVSLRDPRAIWRLLGPNTRARLKEAARKATAIKGAGAEVAPKDLLSPAWRSEAEPDWKPRSFRLVGVQGDRAQVEVMGSLKSQREVVTLVRERGRWKVELDIPMRPALPEVRPKSEPKPKPKPEPKSEPEPKPEPKSEPEPKPEPKPKSEPKSAPEPKPEPEPKEVLK